MVKKQILKNKEKSQLSKKSENSKLKKEVVKKTSTIKTKSSVKTSFFNFKDIKLTTLLPQNIWFGGGLIFIIFFVLYFITAPRTNISYADSDELLTVAYNLGVAHPPGYALYVLLLNFFLHLPIAGSVAFRGHLLSILLHSSALVFVFVSTWRLIEYLQQNVSQKISIIRPELDRWIISLLATASLGTSFLFWLYGSIAEKYALNDLLVSVILFLAVYIFTGSKEIISNKWIIILGGIFGLALAYNQTVIVITPMLLLLIGLDHKNFNKKDLISGAGLMVITILASSGVLFWLNTLNSPVSWNFEPTLKGLVMHILRQDFTGTIVETGQKVTAYFSSINVENSLGTLPYYIKVLIGHFGIVSILVGLLGVWMTYSFSRKLAVLLGSGLIFATILFPLYLLWPDNIGTQAVTMRQYLLGYMMIPSFLAVGWWVVLSRAKKISEIVTKKSFQVNVGIAVSIMVFLSWRIWSVFPEVNLRDYTFISQFHRQVLTNLPKDSLLACFTDTNCFALLYEQKVNGLRPDVVIVPVAYPLVQKQLDKTPNLRGFDYEKNPFKMIDYISWNIDKRPVFVIDMPKTYYELMGLNYGFLYYIPNGYVGQLVKKIPETLSTSDYTMSLEMKKLPTPKLDLMRVWFKTSIARMHIFNSAMYQKMGYRDITRDELNISSDLLFQVPQVPRDEIEGSRTNVESSGPQINFASGTETQSVEEVLKSIDAFLEKGKLQKAYTGALGAVIIDPVNEQARMKLAEIYERMGDKDFALIEYKNVLKYHSQNEQAKNKIWRLESQ